MVTIKDRATFQFLRSWAKINKFGDFFLGVNYTTGDTNNPVKYSDGTAYDKTVDYAFDDNSDKFGAKECNYMKSSIKFKPRDTECTEEMAPICIWNSKYSNYLSNICNYNAIVYIYLNSRFQYYDQNYHCKSSNFMVIPGPTCPSNWVINNAEVDGRSCYGTISQSTDVGSINSLKTCKANDKYLQRPALLFDLEILDQLKPLPS